MNRGLFDRKEQDAMPDTPGKYIFMHQDKPIAELTLDGSSGEFDVKENVAYSGE